MYQQPLTRGINIPSAWRTPVSQIANAVACSPRTREGEGRGGEGSHDPLETPGQRAADSPGDPGLRSATGTMAGSPTMENKIPGRYGRKQRRSDELSPRLFLQVGTRIFVRFALVVKKS